MASLCKNMRLARHGASYISHRLGAMRTFSSNRPVLEIRPNLQVKSDQSNSARFLAPRAFHNVAPHTGDDDVNLFVHTDTFSRLEKHEIDKIETRVFEAGGYMWKLKIYNDDGDDGKSVPVKLALADTSALPENWKLDVAFSICLKNQAPRCYYAVIGRARFDSTTEWGGFFPRHFLTNPSYGYLKNNRCVFGAEVFKVFVNGKEVVTKNMLAPFKRKFKIANFPSLKEGGGWVSNKTWTSEVFSARGYKWMLKVSPETWNKGIGRLSIFLENIVDSDKDKDKLGVIKASYTITLKSQMGDHVKPTSSCRFSAAKGSQWGWNSYIDLASLCDPYKGFILNGCVHLELELSVEEDDSIPSSISRSA